MNKAKRIFVGIIFILVAAALVVNKLGCFGDIGFFRILFSVVLIGIFVKGIVAGRWGRILFSAAFFIIVNDELLHLESLTPWTVLGAALLGTVGLHMFFGRKNTQKWNLLSGRYHSGKEWNELMVTQNGEVIRYGVEFGSSVKYVSSLELSEIIVKCEFGNLCAYLTEAALKEHRAKVNVNAAFGNVDLYIPASWAVTTDIFTSFGSCSEKGKCAGDGEEKLLIQGQVKFSNLVIHYV